MNTLSRKQEALSATNKGDQEAKHTHSKRKKRGTFSTTNEGDREAIRKQKGEND